MDVRRWAVAASLAAAFAALADTGMARSRNGGFYVPMSGLLALPRESEAVHDTDDLKLTARFSARPGVGVLAAAGYRFRSGLQAELELGYRRSRFDKARKITARDRVGSISVPGSHSVDGRLSSISLMANGLYSLNLRRFRPYAGLGLGLALHDADIDPVRAGEGRNAPTGFANSDRATAFAYQAMAGVGYALTRSMELRLGYRYFATAKPDFGALKLSYGAHNIEAGLLYRY